MKSTVVSDDLFPFQWALKNYMLSDCIKKIQLPNYTHLWFQKYHCKESLWMQLYPLRFRKVHKRSSIISKMVLQGEGVSLVFLFTVFIYVLLSNFQVLFIYGYHEYLINIIFMCSREFFFLLTCCVLPQCWITNWLVQVLQKWNVKEERVTFL